ncbi:MAG: threonine/serine exporter family protein [Opitutaceae bacterium]|nr:threonine/serine exporter family protein [Opitutaceae bacterium]
MNLLLALAQDMALASVPAVGFALVFNVPSRMLGYCAMGGAVGHGLRFLLVSEPVRMPIEWATLLAAAVVSLIGVQLARRLRAHPKVFTVAAMIPMVPGVPFFSALLAIVEINREGLTDALLQTAINSGLRALFIIGALAVGLAIPGLLFYRRRPVV